MTKSIAVVVLIIILACVICFAPQQTNSSFLRIHVRANSNSTQDQQIKYVVKDAIVQYLTPFIAQANTKRQAMDVVEQNIDGMTQVANAVLKQNGFDYTSSISLCKEQFPTRSYNGVTLPADVYDALIVSLGSGTGNNWWCVVYPPLCFVGGESNGTNTIVYKSKLQEIIDNWKQNR